MANPKKPKKILALLIFFTVLALCFAASGVLLVANSRLVPIDVSGCDSPEQNIVYHVDRFDAGFTVYARGAAVLPGSTGVTSATTALLRDPDTNTFYRIPTATTAPSDETALALSLGEEAETSGFFARGLRLGSSKAGRELWLLYEDGVVRYLIQTDRSF